MRTELPNIMNNYNPTSGYLVIKDGNPWLASQRAINLSKFLATNVEKQTGVEYNEDKVKVLETSVSESTGNEYQYVEGTLYAILESPPEPEVKYAFDLLYEFYEIDGKPHIVVTKPGMGNPVKVKNLNIGVDVLNGKSDPFVSKLEKDGSDAISSGGFVVFQRAGGQEANIGILVPVPKTTYAKRIGSRLYFNDGESLNNMRKFIQKYSDGKDIYDTDPKSNYLSSNWTQTDGGGGNYIFGKESGANATILTGDNKGKTVIKRTYYKESGKGKGAIEGTGKKGEWVKIGEFKLTKAEGAFADNMIQIQPGSYQKVFDELKKSIDSYMEKNSGFDIKEISASVKGFASADRATNRTNIGTPDHDWGVGFPVEKWITT